jgi:hypothetical protein
VNEQKLMKYCRAFQNPANESRQAAPGIRFACGKAPATRRSCAQHWA